MATRTWIGGGNNQATNAKDWSPSGVPQPGDTLSMRVAAGQSVNFNNGSGLGSGVLQLDDPTQFAGLITLQPAESGFVGPDLIELENLATADSYTYKNDMLSIYSNNHVIDTLRLINQSVTSTGSPAPIELEKAGSVVTVFGRRIRSISEEQCFQSIVEQGQHGDLLWGVLNPVSRFCGVPVQALVPPNGDYSVRGASRADDGHHAAALSRSAKKSGPGIFDL